MRDTATYDSGTYCYKSAECPENYAQTAGGSEAEFASAIDSSLEVCITIAAHDMSTGSPEIEELTVSSRKQLVDMMSLRLHKFILMITGAIGVARGGCDLRQIFDPHLRPSNLRKQRFGTRWRVGK
jgi:hypothetical protein